jgi:flagellar capping protein FliD
MRDLLFGRSSTPGEVVRSLADLGVSVDRNGVASFEEAAFDEGVREHFQDVVLMFSANTTNQSEYGQASRGLAGDTVKKINELLSQRGFLQVQTNNAELDISRTKRSLETLEERMEQLLTRYTRQFAVMETIVGQSNSLRESLKGQFEAMAAAYNQK